MGNNAQDGDNIVSDKKDKLQQNKYRSSKLILDYIYKEYSRENERRKSIESRITVLITISTFFIGAILVNNNINFSKMFQNQDKNLYLFVCLQILSCTTIIVAIGMFISILISREYRTISTDNFMDIKPQGAEEGIVAYDLIKAYKKCLDFNKEVNDSKFRVTNIGIALLFISIALYLIIKIVYIYSY